MWSNRQLILEMRLLSSPVVMSTYLIMCSPHRLAAELETLKAARAAI